MGKASTDQSNAERELPESPSVYDFLYQDVRRVGSFLAQFDPSGHLQTVKQTQSSGESATEGTKLKGGASIHVLHGDAAKTEDSSRNWAHAAEMAYDPLWVNAINLLTFLQQQNFLVRKLDGTRLGQFVLLSGDLFVFDTANLKPLWEDESIVRKLLAEADKTVDAAKAKDKSARDLKTVTMKLMRQMPHLVQATLRTPEGLVWCVLNQASLEIASSNLFLKYGVRISGEWNILGVLDALLDDETVLDDEKPEEMNSLIDVMHSFGNLGRRLGRPKSAYGITPLLVFRQVGANR